MLDVGYWPNGEIAAPSSSGQKASDLSNVMVVVLDNEIHQIQNPHGLFEAGVNGGPLNGGLIEGVDAGDESSPLRPEFVEKFADRPVVVMRLVGLPIGEIGIPQTGLSGEYVFHTAEPQGFEIEEVSDVFLNGPSAARTMPEAVGRQRPDQFIQPGGRTAKACDEVWKVPRGQVEFKRSVEPAFHRPRR